MSAGKPALRQLEAALAQRLQRWQRASQDPWLCAPAAVLLPGARCGALLSAP